MSFRESLPGARLVGAPYIVRHGAYLQGKAEFEAFRDALACFTEHYPNRPERARLLGATYDDTSDGLTPDERDQVEFAEEQAIAGGGL